MSVRFPNVAVNRLLMTGAANMVASVCFVAKDITKKGVDTKPYSLLPLIKVAHRRAFTGTPL